MTRDIVFCPAAPCAGQDFGWQRGTQPKLDSFLVRPHLDATPFITARDYTNLTPRLGLPNLRFFPFDTLEAQSAKPERWTPSPNEPPLVTGDGGLAGSMPSLTLHNRHDASGGGSSDSQAARHITVPKVMSPDTDVLKKIDLATALQYGTAQGYPPLFSFIRQFTREALHPNVPYEGGAEIVLDVGSTDGFFKTLDTFVDPWNPETGNVRDRPGLLCETFVYASILSQSMPRGVQIVPVKADEGGMVATGPGSLEDVLANWDYNKGRRPHLMYTVTYVEYSHSYFLIELSKSRSTSQSMCY